MQALWHRPQKSVIYVEEFFIPYGNTEMGYFSGLAIEYIFKQNKCSQRCPFLEQGRKMSFDFYNFTINCSDMKFSVNNNVIRNKIFPTGALCEK